MATSLAERNQGQLPSMPDPKEIVNVIIVRSGHGYEGPSMPVDDDSRVSTSDLIKKVAKEVITEKTVAEKVAHEKEVAHKVKKGTKIQVTVPFAELILQVPAYAKFMKGILTRKCAFCEVETVAFTEEYSALLQNKSPRKLKDPGSFSIPCARVCVMLFFVFAKLNTGELKVTNITQQMTDDSVKYPLGVLEDVTVRVGKFYIRVDYVVLDMQEDTQIPMILCRPFLHIAGAIIDVKSGKLTLSVGDDKVHIVRGSNYWFQRAVKESQLFKRTVSNQCTSPPYTTPPSP
ncbi:uncharacterized protein [Spinacia oleracea]|uniref:Aspartic peptidase DDI1-type domain-containing protein n=1 Tax=Spinacia oleracea TaxID=3562 RepID=A0ABM3QYB1_SPIOL|nr:uncharacterized protein LOC130463299 [Spinacia oleracea]